MVYGIATVALATRVEGTRNIPASNKRIDACTACGHEWILSIIGCCYLPNGLGANVNVLSDQECVDFSISHSILSRTLCGSQVHGFSAILLPTRLVE